MLMATRLKAAYGALALVDSALAASSRSAAHRARFATKPLLMPLLSASLAAGSRQARPPGGARLVRRAVLAAQAAGWVGDVALLSEERKPFVVGTAAFGVGHLAYLAAFVPRRRREPALAGDPRARALAGVWVATAPVVVWNARGTGVAAVVAAYSTTLAAMAVAAVRVEGTPSARRLVTAGALLFLASDATLGLRRFVLEDPSPLVEGAVMASYTSAQLLLGEGASRLQVSPRLSP